MELEPRPANAIRVLVVGNGRDGQIIRNSLAVGAPASTASTVASVQQARRAMAKAVFDVVVMSSPSPADLGVLLGTIANGAADPSVLVVAEDDPDQALTGTAGSDALVLVGHRLDGEAARHAILSAAYDARASRQLVDRPRQALELFDAVTEGVSVLDRDGRILYMNRAAEQLGRLPRSLAIGRLVWDLWPGVMDSPYRHAFQKVLSSGRPQSAQMDYPAFGVWLEIRLYPSDDGVVSFVLDTTEKREAQDRLTSSAAARDVARAALEEGEARFLALIEHASDAIGVMGDRAQVVYASPQANPVLGLEPETIVGRRALRFVHPDDRRAAITQVLAATASPGETIESELRVRHSDGTWRDVELRATSRLGDGPVRGIVLNVRDITARKRAQRLAGLHEVVLGSPAQRLPLSRAALQLATAVEAVVDGASCAVLVKREGRRGLTVVAPNLDPRLAGTTAALHGSPGITDGPSSGIQVIEDIASSDGPAVWREACRTAGLVSCWAVPIVFGKDVVGAVQVYLARPVPIGPFERELLELASNLLAIAVDRDDARARLDGRILRDPLTGLPTRAVLIGRLDHALGRARREATNVVVLLVDVDRLAVVNESLGRASGDELLVAIAERLRSALRPGDTLARYGDDEFAVVRESPEAEEAMALSSALSTALKSPIPIGDRSLSVTASIGVAIAGAGGVWAAEELLRNAEGGLYHAKERGRGHMEIFDAELRGRGLRRLEMETSLRAAIGDGQLRLQYQPQVSLWTGEVLGVEALVRWAHPELGLLPPLDFIPLAEETGLIVPLGAWVIQQACRDLARWTGRGREIQLSVNVSASQLADPALPDLVASVLAETGLDAARLNLEITESVLLDEGEGLQYTIEPLASLGVQFGVDDFGTGHSSLLYLKRIPITQLKIDRSFVQSIEKPRDEAIIRSIVAMAKDLGIVPVAEGVDSRVQVMRLLELGCDVAQGFLFSRPVDLAVAGEYASGVSRALERGSRRAGGSGGRGPGGMDERAMDLRPTRVAIADGNRVVAELLPLALSRSVRRYEAIGTASTLADLRDLLRRTAADVVVVGDAFPDAVARDVVRHVREAWPRTKIVHLYAEPHSPSRLADIVAAGADSAASLDLGVRDLIDTIEQTVAGRTMLPTGLVAHLSREISNARAPRYAGSLTSRERAAVGALVDGGSTEAAAANLGMSATTCRTHIHRAMRKRRVPTRLELAARALQEGLVHVEPVAPAGPQVLTARERAVLQAIFRVGGVAAAGERLGLGESTVRSHLQSISEKLGATTQIDALRIAVASGLLPRTEMAADGS